MALKIPGTAISNTANVTIQTISAGSNVAVNTSTISIGNSTVNTSILSATILINGVNVNTAITANADAAYSNAIAYSGNATNISSGTVAFARLPALYLGTTTIQSTSAAQAVSGITTLATGNTTITGFISVSTNTATFGTAAYVVANGNVGIGTSSPATKLDVSSTTAAATFTTTQTLGNAVTINVDGSSGTPVGLRVAAGIATIGSTAKLINVINSAGDNLFNVQASGNVGIGGAATLSSTLDVTGIASFAAGSAALPSITRTGDLNTGFWFPAADTIAASTGGTERMRIAPTYGNVLIGATSQGAASIGYMLGIQSGGSQTYLSIAKSGQTLDTGGMVIGIDGTGGAIYVRPNQPLDFYTNDTQRVRFAADGQVGIGTTSPTGKLHVSGYAGGVGLRLTRDISTDILDFYQGGGVSYIDSSIAGGQLAFVTAGTERMRLTSTGLGIGGTPSYKFHLSGGQYYIAPSGTYTSYTGDGLWGTTATPSLLGSNGQGGSYSRFGAPGMIIGYQDNGNGLYSPAYGFEVKSIDGRPVGGISVKAIVLKDIDTNTLVFYVNTTGNVLNVNNSYGSASDVSIKENITDASSKLNDLLNVRVRNYNLKADPNKLKQLGVIAQELETVFPGIVETDTEGLKSVKYSIFVPMLIKAIQEQQVLIQDQKVLIQSLTTRLTAVEAR